MTGILIILISIFVLESCKTRVELVPIGEAKVVGRLENGNWEVTPAFLAWVGELKAEVERLRKQIK